MVADTVSRDEFLRLKEELEHLRENVALLANKELLEEIEEARKRRNKGEGESLEDVKKDVLG